MGSIGQKMIRPIEGYIDVKLEINGFVYKNKDISKFHFKVEIINPKTSKNLTFNTSRIPDIYLIPDLNLDNNNIEISRTIYNLYPISKN